MDRQKNVIPRSFSLPSLWEEIEDRVGQWIGTGKGTGLTISEDKDNLYVEAQVPGLKASDIDISLHKNVLLISGVRKITEEDQEKKYYRQASHSYSYEAELPVQVDEESSQAAYQDGLLKITFKKIQKDPARKIKVKESHLDRPSSEHIDIKK
jgi:HSP20 family protein